MTLGRVWSRIPHPVGRSLLVALPVALTLSCVAMLGGCSLTVREPSPVVPSGVAGEVMRSTVDVVAQARTGGWTVEQGLGTGVVFNRDGVIVTNDHVVDLRGRRPDSITVRTLDGRRAEARVLGRLPALDLAFLKVDIDGLRPARFAARIDHVVAGDKVIAVGAPHHFPKPVVRGRVLHVLENVRVQNAPALRALIESSVRLREGFSGGPLADARGRVVGINTATSPRVGRDTSLSIPAPVVLEAAGALGLVPGRG